MVLGFACRFLFSFFFKGRTSTTSKQCYSLSFDDDEVCTVQEKKKKYANFAETSTTMQIQRTATHFVVLSILYCLKTSL